jgi:hypothetical protein
MDEEPMITRIQTELLEVNANRGLTIPTYLPSGTMISADFIIDLESQRLIFRFV